MRCLLIADDLTGAADACVKFVTHGFSGTVALTLDAGGDADVLAINIDSRRRSETEARQRIREVSRLVRDPQVAVFKKIDSTLRGHAGAEIDEAMIAFGCTHAIVTPAFPAMGRTVRDGMLMVGDRVVCDIAALLASQGLRVDSRVRVCDAASQGDLDAIAAAASDGGGSRSLWAGSAGLAQALAARLASTASPRITMPGASASASARARARASLGGSVVLFIGSHHAVTEEQKTHLLAARDVDATIDISEALNRGRHVLVSNGRVSEHVNLTAADRARIAGFVMSGGDTAADVCRVLGASHLDLGGEVEQGVPWGVLRGGIADGLPMVLKSGAFGTPDTLIAALDFLHVRH